MAKFSREPVHDGQILTLAIDQGKKWDARTGEGAIASIDRSIVFAPRGAVPGKQARLKLAVLKNADGTPRTDAGGFPMYRAVPAPVAYADRWRDNGDGTASRVTYSINWLLAESEEGVCETRPLGKREGLPSSRAVTSVKWGSDKAATIVEKAEVKSYPQETETVRDGQVVWQTTGQREERGQAALLPVLKVKVWAGDFDVHRLEPNYQDKWSLTADVYCADTDYVRQNTVWGQLPLWLRQEVEGLRPLCSCGRQRLVTQADGYAKCELCRNEERCSRCGAEGRVAMVGGEPVCAACEPKVRLEQVAMAALPADRRAQVAAEARRLLAGRAMPREVGELFVQSTLDHLSDEWTRARITSRASGWAWYYLCPTGLFGSKFSPEALELLALFDRARGNGLVEMAAWLAGAGGCRKVEECESWGDYYHRSQVKGENFSPSFDSSSFGGTSLSLAVRLRGSEADRLAALAAYDKAVADFGSEVEELQAVRRLLQAEEQDYAGALSAVRRASAALAPRPVASPVAVASPSITDGRPADLSQVNLSGLFGGRAKVRGR